MHYRLLNIKINKFNKKQKRKNKNRQNLQINIQERNQLMEIVKYIQKKISSYVIVMKKRLDGI